MLVVIFLQHFVATLYLVVQTVWLVHYLSICQSLKIKTWKCKYIWASTASNSYDKASLKWLVLAFVHCQHLWYCQYFVKERWENAYSSRWLLLLLSRFSHVRLCATPETAAHQAPPSLGFSRQEHWSGLPLPSPMHESEKWKGSRSVVSNS